MSSSSDSVREAAEQYLACLIGLRLVHSKTAGSMRIFVFERANPPFRAGIHIETSWRIEIDGRVHTGSDDYYAPSPRLPSSTHFDISKDESLLYFRLRAWLDIDASGDVMAGPVITNAEVNSFGDLCIMLDTGARLVVFPTASDGRLWTVTLPTGNFAVDANRYFWVETSD